MFIDLRRIRSFVALAEHGGFRVAAEALGVSQPTLSAHIMELEAELRVPLVSRTTRRVRLTSMGDKFLARARRAIEELESAALELRDEAALKRGRVIVACNPTLAEYTMPAVVRAFADKFPAVTVEVIDDISTSVERYVIDGAADFGIAPTPRAAALNYQKLADDRFVAALPVGVPLGNRPRLALADLTGERMIAMLPGTSIRRTVEEAFDRAGLPYEPKFMVRHHTTALGLVEAGLGVAIVPENAVAQPRLERLRVVEIDDPPVVRDLCLLNRRGEALTPASVEFVAVLRRAINKAARKPDRRSSHES